MYAMAYHINEILLRRNNMKAITVTEARKNLFKLIDEVQESSRPIQITGKRSNVVMVSFEDWQSIQETLYLISIPGMHESIIEGINTPIEGCDKEIEWE